MQDPNTFLWEISYRPKSIKDVILPEKMKQDFLKEIESGSVSNYLFESPRPGTGKTTSALALCNDIDADVLFLNASENGNIDQLRSTIRGFASTVSLSGSPKVVILDEFDNASDSFQKAFRGFIEEFSDNCRFILTCNYANNIIEPIRDRLKIKTFIFPEEEKVSLMKQAVLYLLDILKKEGIECTNPKIVGEIVKQNYPKIRTCVKLLQDYSRHGVIDEGILGIIKCDDSVNELILAIKDKNFKDVNALIPRFANDYGNFITTFYDRMYSVIEPSSIPTLIEIIGENQCYANQVPDMQIHLRFLCVLIMKEVGFK